MAAGFAEGEVSKEDAETLSGLFQKALGNDKLTVRAENMTDEDVAAIMTLSEQSRRMQDMMKAYGMGDDPSMFGGQEELVLNAGHPLVKYVLDNPEEDITPVICCQLYDLALLSHKPMTQEEMTAFVKRSNEIMMRLTR